MQGEVVAIPVYPSTWVSVRLATGEVVKLRSPNFEIINEEQGVVPVQTDRLRRSLVFNALGPGAKISILHHKRYTPASGFPVTATIMDNTPVFPRWVGSLRAGIGRGGGSPARSLGASQSLGSFNSRWPPSQHLADCASR